MRDRRLPVHFFATIRATDIVRDRDILPLYREAGILYVLMGIESTSDEVLRQIKKGSTTREDLPGLPPAQGARHLLDHRAHRRVRRRRTWSTFRTALRQLRLYDGDYLNAMYVTPHAWTPFGEEVQGRRVVQPDQAKWDYRHQVLAQKHLRPWQLFLAVKWLELRFHLTPGRLWSLLGGGDRFRRRQRPMGVPAHRRGLAGRGRRVPAHSVRRPTPIGHRRTGKPGPGPVGPAPVPEPALHLLADPISASYNTGARPAP